MAKTICNLFIIGLTVSFLVVLLISAQWLSTYGPAWCLTETRDGQKVIGVGTGLAFLFVGGGAVFAASEVSSAVDKN